MRTTCRLRNQSCPFGCNRSGALDPATRSRPALHHRRGPGAASALLPVYHRVFDELLLIFVIPALAELRYRSRPLYWGVTALTFLWIFSHRLLSHLFPRTALFPYTAFVGVAICLGLILSLGVGRHGELRKQQEAALEAGGQPQVS